MDWLGTLFVGLIAVIALWALVVFVLWLHRPTRELAGPALRLIPDIARLGAHLVADPVTPRRHKVALIGLVAWLAMPIDLVPDFLPVVGQLDDLIVAALVLRWIGQRFGRERLREHWSGTPEGFALLERLLGSSGGLV